MRALDRYGNIRADEAADFGRRRVWPEVTDARRNLSGVCRRWYPVVQVLHRFFIAISRAVVNCDDSSSLAPHPLIWSAGSLPKRRRVADVVRNVALLPGPVHIWDSGWVGVHPSAVTAEDMYVFGRILLGFWSSWLLSWVLFTGPLQVLIWDLVVSPVLSVLSFMNFGLVREVSVSKGCSSL